MSSHARRASVSSSTSSADSLDASSCSSASSSSGRSRRSQNRHSMPPVHPSEQSQGWWEDVLPSGQLAERLRRAHGRGTGPSPSASASTTPSTTANNTPRMSSSAFSRPHSGPSTPQLSFPRSETNEHLHFPSANATSTATRLRSASKRDRVQSLDGFTPASTRAVGKQKQPSGELGAHPEDGSRLAELQSRSRHQSMLASAPCPSARSRLLRSDRLSTGRFSPLARTPELSSGSEEENHAPHPHEEPRVTRSQSTSAGGSFATSSSQRQHRHQRISRVVSRTVSANSTSMTEQDWADLINARGARRGNQWHDGDSHAPPPRSRRVSFDLSDQDGSGRSAWRAQADHHVFHSHGHEYTYSQAATGESTGYTSPPDHWYHTTSSATMHRRRTRMTSRGSGASAFQHGRTMSSASASAPVSRRGSFQQIPTTFDERARQSSQAHSDKHLDTDLLNELPVLRSIHAAHDHLTKTTSQALALSKSILMVPAPVLRPLFHFALIWCVSGATIMALVGCLFASYMLTAWDDVGETGREVRKQASGMRPWGNAKAPSISDDAAESATSNSRRGSGDSTSSSSSSDSNFSSTHSAALDAGRIVLDSLVFSPLTYAAKWPVAVAKSLTPSAVPTPAASRRASFAAESSDTDEGSAARAPGQGRKPRSGQGKPTRPHNMPPRPPLASLIPSMLLTLMLAIGAGLVGGWAKRRSEAASPSAGTDGPASAASSRMVTPLASPRVHSPLGAVDPASAAYVFSHVNTRPSDDPSMVGLGIGNHARGVVH